MKYDPVSAPSLVKTKNMFRESMLNKNEDPEIWNSMVCCQSIRFGGSSNFQSMFNEQFVHVIQDITGYLRRQKYLITSMKSTCPHFIEDYALAEVVSSR
jgi:hypothetical protein